MTLLKDGEYKPATDEEMQALFRSSPNIARLWKDPEVLRNLSIDSSANSILYECWDQVARRILSQVTRMPHAKMFLVAVDPDTQNMPDYHEIVKHPMDFGLIK